MMLKNYFSTIFRGTLREHPVLGGPSGGQEAADEGGEGRGRGRSLQLHPAVVLGSPETASRSSTICNNIFRIVVLNLMKNKRTCMKQNLTRAI